MSFTSCYLLGIGKFIALDFARRGARVILACRSEARGTAALQEIRESTGNQNVHLRLLDTSSLDSVRKFAARILEEEKELHILVNNAGASGGTAISFSINLSFIQFLCPYKLWFVHAYRPAQWDHCRWVGNHLCNQPRWPISTHQFAFRSNSIHILIANAFFRS